MTSLSGGSATAARSQTAMHRFFAISTLIMSLAFASAAPDDPEAFVTKIDKQIQAWQPTKKEKRFDEIGWVKDIRTALKLAKEHERPVFLFTHDGRMGIGRC